MIPIEGYNNLFIMSGTEYTTLFLWGCIIGFLLSIIIWIFYRRMRYRKEYMKTLNDKDYRNYKEYLTKI